MIITDLYNSVRNISFKLVFWIYIIINLAAFIICVNSELDTNYMFIRSADENFFLMDTEASFLRYTFTIIYPITSCMIASLSLSADIRSGRMVTQCHRCGISKYLQAKLISTIILTFVCSTVPFFINLILCHLIYPSVGYESQWLEVKYYIGQFSYDGERFLDMLRLEHGTLYNIAHILIIGVFAVLIAVLAMGISIFLHERALMCFLLPVILSLVIHVIKVITIIIGKSDYFIFNYLLTNDKGSVKKFVLIIMLFCALDVVTMHFGRKRLEK